ncbi:MAG: DEAD/DEAH box helicase [Verrucomicrobia bacterium]|nr:DEAD/DEAH box helicase [Verrucomicrobiota bacterium]
MDWKMAKPQRNNGHHASSATTKYDAHHQVLDRTYGALADLRRELADSKTAVAARNEILRAFASCADSQRSWLLLEDYFEKLCLARKDFAGEDWWPRLLQAQGQTRLEALAFLFLRSGRPLPTELAPHANYERLAEMEQAEQEQQFSRFLDDWLLPPAPVHLDSPRAALRVVCEVQPLDDQPTLHNLKVQFAVSRPKSGEKLRTVSEVVELATRSGHEQELFPPADCNFILWLKEMYGERKLDKEWLALNGMELLQWLARWGQTPRLVLPDHNLLGFHGQLAEMSPHLETEGAELFFSHRLTLPECEPRPLEGVHFFAGHPTLVLVNQTFYLVRNPGPPNLFASWISAPRLPVRKLSHRLLTHLRKSSAPNDQGWQTLCVAHRAVPQFLFELNEETVRLRLLARSEIDQSAWQWSGHEWQVTHAPKKLKDKPQILDDPRLEPAVHWLRRLDWFTPEPGLWVGDANEQFLNSLAAAWPDRPAQAEYLGNPAFHRLFLSPRRLRPKLIVQGSGIDWFAVSAAWEAEGLKLTPADLQRLASATGRFVKLPDGGWMELDSSAVRAAHEAVADLGLDGLSPVAQRVDMAHAAQLDEATLVRFQDQSSTRTLRERLAEFTGVPTVPVPASVQAELRPYQKDGVNFLCHLTRLKLGGVLADDMGLGKTLQTLVWLAWQQEQNPKKRKPALVICPASVLHNWRRESNRFAPHLKVLVLESGAARHNLRKQIPQHDLIVTNYALLRRDLAALQKFEFRAIILDEAQYIKNPAAQVTQCVKQLKADHRFALTGTPLENRLLDLWSIVDFVQPGYLGTQSDFHETYEPKSEDVAWGHQIARRRLAAKIRPLMLRRLKRQVAQDLPDRIEQRRDCELTEEQRKLYLAELRRSREQVQQTVIEKGLAKSKIHILAALTRLRQICCHPHLVGNDSASGKTETLFELLEPLIAEGQKVLVFSQFVQMLKLLEEECQRRQFTTYILTGETKNRQDVVQAFQNDPNASLFLLSLRAAGTGLNLTTASYVVLYDPWWNPAVEAQAIDRSHRIGQTRTVNAYRLIAPGTVEEKIWELQQRKAQTISDVLGEEGFARSLTKSDLEYLFAED